MTKHIPYILIYCIALSIGLYFRLHPLIKYTPDETREKATVLVLNQIKSQIASTLETQNPNLPTNKKEQLIQQRLNILLKKDKDNFHNTVEKTAHKLNPESKNPFPYLLASDSFYYYNLTENIEQTGKLSDTVKGSKYLNNLMLAPLGHWEPFNLHPYVGYYIFRFLKIFNPEIPLMYAVSFTPLIITALSLIPFLAICRLFNFHIIVSLTSSIFFLLAPIFVKRSTFGWYDNDPYNTLFPLTILAFLFYGLRASKIKMQYIYAALTILSMSLYALFWHGWMLIFTILVISAFIIFLDNYFIIKQKENTKHLLTYFGIIFTGIFLGVSLKFGPQEFFILFAEGFKALKNFMAPQLALWPDLYISVSELHNASLPLIIELTGGKIFFSIAIFGLIISLINLRNPKFKERIPTIILTIFLITSLIITTGAQRFAMLCLTPLSLFFAFGLHYTKRGLTPFFKKGVRPLFVLVLTLTAIPIYNINTSIKSLLNPIFNDTWGGTLINIRDNTPKNSIINTWWSPGHFVKAIAKRRVTFDGASINYPQAYWLSNFFLSQTEEEALGILRMLNNSANQASEYLHEELGLPLSASVAILKQITKQDKKQAYKLLTKIMPNEKYIHHLLNLTHATPPPSYCLVYNEFVESNLQLKFIGDWNFKAIEDINKNPERIAAIPKRNSPEYVDFLWNLAGGAYKYSGILSQLNQQKDTILFQNNVQINTKNMTCRINSPKYGKGIPRSLFYLKENTIVEKKFPDANLSYSVTLFKEKGRYNIVLSDHPLANSLLFKLYFFKAKGLKHFELFSHESDLTKRTIIDVFKVNW